MAYRMGVCIAVLTSFLTIWTTIVRDDGTGAGFFLIILTAVVGAFAAWFQPAGMTRTMLGVGIMQTLFGVAIATAPSTAEPIRALVFNGVFALFWLVSASLFRAARLPETRV